MSTKFIKESLKESTKFVMRRNLIFLELSL